MKNPYAAQSILLVYLAAGCARGPALSSGLSAPDGPRSLVLGTLSPEDKEAMRVTEAIDRLREAGRIERAEPLVDAHLGDPAYGSFLPLAKAEILAKRGQRAEALDLDLATLRDPKMYWSPNSRDLVPVLELAVGLGRSADVDEVATRMIAHPCTTFFEGAVQTPRAAATPRERLAYAYLDISADTWEGRNPERRARYARKAQALLPNAIPVRVQLADILAERGKPGDRDEAASLLRLARAQAGIGAARREVESVAQGARVALDPPTSISLTSAGRRG